MRILGVLEGLRVSESLLCCKPKYNFDSELSSASPGENSQFQLLSEPGSGSCSGSRKRVSAKSSRHLLPECHFSRFFLPKKRFRFGWSSPVRGFFSRISNAHPIHHHHLMDEIPPLSDRSKGRFFFIFETEPNFGFRISPDSSSLNPEQSVKVELNFPLPGTPQSDILPRRWTLDPHFQVGPRHQLQFNPRAISYRRP